LTDGILALLEAHNGSWEGTSTELVRKLQELDPTSREFQKLSASSVGKRLASSLRGDLRAVGVEVDQGKGNKGQRYLILSRVAERVVEPEKTMPQSPPVSTPSLDKEEEQPIPTTPQTPTPEKNNGAAVPSTPIPASAPAKPEVAEKKTPVEALQSVNGRVHNTEGRVTVSSPPITSTAKPELSHSREHEGDSHITNKEWNSLLDACCRAGVPHWQLREVISHAAGIPKGNVGTVPLTRAQYRRALSYLATYRNTVATDVPPQQAALPLDNPAGGIPPWHWDR
jgi:hypothetical protein